MPFRVSTGSSFTLFQSLIGRQNSNMLRLQEQMATQKRINRPSDDPNSAQILAGFRNDQGRVDQYLRNIDTADRNWRQIESTISEMNELLISAKEKAIQGNNGTMSDSDRELLAEDIHQKAEQLLALGNTQISGEYIFAGYSTDTKPFELDANYPNADPAASYNGSSQLKSIQIEESQSFEIQFDMDSLLLGDGSPEEVDVFQTMANLEQALLDNNVDDDDPASVGQAIEDLEAALGEIRGALAEVGAKTNRIDDTKERLQTQKDITTSFISQIEDADVTELFTEFQRAQIALQATVGSAGSILNQPSLINFIN